MKTRTNKRTKNVLTAILFNLITVKPASMIGTPVQNDDKKAGQRTLIGQNKKEKKNVSSAVSYLSFALSHGKLRASSYRLPNVVRELWQKRRRRLRKRHLKSEVALLQTLSRLFHLVHFVKCWKFLLELNSKRRMEVQGKKKEVVVFCLRPPLSLFSRCSRAVTSKKYTKKRDARAESFLANLNLLLFCRSRS